MCKEEVIIHDDISNEFDITSVLKLLCLYCKTISKVVFLITTLWISLKKGECYDFSHLFGSLTYFIHRYQTSRSSLSFQLVELLSLFIYAFSASSHLLAVTRNIKHLVPGVQSKVTHT